MDDILVRLKRQHPTSFLGSADVVERQLHEVTAIKKQDRIDAAEEIEKLRKVIKDAHDALNGEPEYHDQGMGCGLEDRAIGDPYEAMAYGWEAAMERVYSEHINYAVEILAKAILVKGE